MKLWIRLPKPHVHCKCVATGCPTLKLHWYLCPSHDLCSNYKYCFLFPSNLGTSKLILSIGSVCSAFPPSHIYSFNLYFYPSGYYILKSVCSLTKTFLVKTGRHYGLSFCQLGASEVVWQRNWLPFLMNAFVTWYTIKLLFFNSMVKII